MIPTFDLKRRKGQGAFEYILLVAGILLIVVIVVFLLKGGLQSQAGSSGAVTQSTSKVNINVEAQCLDYCGDGAWAAYGVQATDFRTLTNASVGNCTLADGVNGNGNCYFDVNTNSSPSNATGYCSANYVLTSGLANTKGLLNSTGITVVRPQNTAFCTYVRQARAA